MSIAVGLRTALYGRLNGASLGVQRVVQGRVQDADAGASTGYPMLRIGAIVMGQRDTQTSNGETALIRLHTFSRSGSQAQAAGIQDAIYTALHRKPLTITGYKNVSLLRVDTTILDGDEGQAHGVCEYRAIIQKT